jgi:hypothetical protein
LGPSSRCSRRWAKWRRSSVRCIPRRRTFRRCQPGFIEPSVIRYEPNPSGQTEPADRANGRVTHHALPGERIL